MPRRALHWGSALRDIRDDRATRNEVRSEPLKSYTAGKSLIAWRGRSGRRYVFSVYAIADIDASDLAGMVVVGVDADGEIVDAIALCGIEDIDGLQDAGATHVHLHSLCDSLRERTDVARDLRAVSHVEAA